MQRVFPTLRISDYARARDFYVDGLGFEIQWEFRHQPGLPVFLQISREGLSLYLSQHEGDCGPRGCAYLYVGDVERWHREAVERGLAVESEPSLQPWGNRETVLVDPDGNRLVIATPEEPPPE